jgi:hypothetical protein
MPNLNPVLVTMTINQKVELHANPVDTAGDPAIPAQNYGWAETDATALGALTPGGPALENCEFNPSAEGTAHITATNQSPNGTEISNWTITVNAGPYDHSAPSADAPVSK